MMGVLVVLWMLYGATGLIIDTPWKARKSRQVDHKRSAADETQLARVEPERPGIGLVDVAAQSNTSDKPQRASLRQWFNTLFPARLDATPSTAAREQRASYTQERLDHYSRLYGIALPD